MARIRVCGVCLQEVRACLCDDEEPAEAFTIDDGGEEDEAP